MGKDNSFHDGDPSRGPFFSGSPERSDLPDDSERYIGTEINQYLIKRELGRGAMGIVYLAQDKRLSRSVAVKLLPEKMRDNPEALQNLQQEAKLLAQLNQPNIGIIYDILERDNNCYLVLEYVPGQTLAERLAEGRLSLKEIMSIAIQIVAAISAAHKVGIIHRDLKPANIKITEESKVKILDFGIGITSGNSTSNDADNFMQQRTWAGTPAYMSPEQVRRETIDHRADIWAFGCILYEMLTGSIPFAGNSTSDMYTSILTSQPDYSILSADIDRELKNILSNCLDKDVDKRYSSAEELLSDLNRYQNMLKGSVLNLSVLCRHFRRPRIAIALLVIAITVSWGTHYFVHRAVMARWARAEAIPKIVNRIEQQQYCNAYNLALEASQWIPDDQMLNSLWPKMSTSDFSLETIPSDAKIFYREYSDVDGDWKYLGVSPVSETRFPFGFYRLRIQKDGFEASERMYWNTNPRMFSPTLAANITLSPKGSLPFEMVQVPSFQLPESLVGVLRGKIIQLESFLIDRYEVTNKEYFEFVNDGGYQNRELWQHRFIKKDGNVLSWDQVMAQFRDLTGNAGPKFWKDGRYPVGEDDFPVSGVSWYEAVAYAKYKGKVLPTVCHWVGTAMPLFLSTFAIPLSNFGKEGVKTVGSTQGISIFGTYDMAGNVREWCYNATDSSETRRYIMGGAWNDPDFMFYVPIAESPLDRSEKTGFRCMKYVQQVDKESSARVLRDPVNIVQRNLHNATPVSEHEFRLLTKGHFSYDYEMPLDIEHTKFGDITDYCRKEKVTINAAYGGERMDIFLFLPKDNKAHRPYQAVVIFPSAAGLTRRSSSRIPEEELKLFIVKSGRAVIFPVYQGMYERGPLPYHWELTVSSLPLFQWFKDWMRTIDYLETRSDIDMNRLAFYGYSLGGVMGAYISGFEKQPFRACVLRGGGIPVFEIPPPDRDPVNYLPRIKIPVLMINGRNDTLLPLDASQKPMFELIGTPKESKHHVVIFEGKHKVPQEKLETEIIQFLDRYLGEPNRHIP